jgi:hypothetical protein
MEFTRYLGLSKDGKEIEYDGYAMHLSFANDLKKIRLITLQRTVEGEDE